MRKLLVSAALLALASPAFAGLNLDGRYDYQSVTSNSQTSSTQASESFFAFNYLRATYDGKLSDTVSFEGRLNFLAFNPGTQAVADSGNNNGTKPAYVGLPGTGYGVYPAQSGLLIGSPATNGANDYIDYAQVVNKISDNFSLVLGKLKDDGLGGFESQVKSADFYFLSQGYLGNKDMVGAQLVYKIVDGQEVDFYFLNNDSATDTSRPGVNLVYRGSFGNFGVIANYSQIGEGQAAGSGGGLKDLNKNYGTAGVSYAMDDWKFTLDYDFYTNATAGATGVGFSKAGNNTTLNDIVATAKYTWGNWTPAIKIESLSRQGYETAGTSDVTDNGINWSVAAEYKKNATDPFRYHVAYVNGTTTYASNAAYGASNSTVTGQFAFLGLRYVGDFLK